MATTATMGTVADKSRVLVVDDEPQITRVLRTVLTSHGYQVRTAAEGESALANFTEWRPELVITDLYMPHMDGIELCRRIRAQSNVPIIVLSVKGEERTKVEALDSGADDYVTKPSARTNYSPVSARTCVDRERKATSRRSMSATSASTSTPGACTFAGTKSG